ncbi:DUF4489 domain-containing protein [Wukongibacter baidiensis]|uniref:DUF4489 domain-containing protein n=1 Tax=Wukongibacter baidiensis TaxID=1723361 RepID=UPI003D7FDEF3
MAYNHTYQEQEVCEIDRSCNKCGPKYQKFKKVLLECGDGTGSRTFTSPDDIPFQLARIVIDTTCLNKSEILIKFSSLVRVERLNPGATVRLKYELIRTCEDQDYTSLGTWIFEKANISGADFTRNAEESFNFIFCESQICTRCCDYFVLVTPIEVTNVTATVSNGRMAAIIQSLKNCTKDNCNICEPTDNCAKSKFKLSEAKDTVLACGSGNGEVTFKRENEPSVEVARVEIDTSCLCDSKILIEFSTIIGYLVQSSSATVNYQFELFRVCDNGESVSRGIWQYEIGVIAGSIKSTQGFGFTFCECMSSSGCCEYFVTLTPIEIPMIEDFDSSMISNSRMVAIAQSSKAGADRYYTKERKLSSPKSKTVLLECGSGTGSKTFTSSDDSAFQLAQVTLDAEGLCNSIVNIEFSSIVSFESVDIVDALLRFELFRECVDGREEPLGVWILERVSQNTEKTTESFDFTFCEPITCKTGCCTYFVRVTPIEIGRSEDIQIQVTVGNGRIAALVQEVVKGGI